MESVARVCKRCLQFGNESSKVHETIRNYIDNIEEEAKVSHEDYKERLIICETCEALSNGMCKYCGCFTLVRAIKKNQSCPYPNKKKWPSVLAEG